MTTRSFARWRRFLPRVAALALPAAVVVALPSEASAQGWMSDRRFQDGQGLRTGDFEFHPGIGAEIGYDSNYFLRSHKDGPNVVNAAPTAPVREGAILRITPSVSVNTVTKNLENGAVESKPIRFSGNVAATYREFFGPQELRDQRNISGIAGIRADINQGGTIAFAVFAGYQRLIQPAVQADPNLSFNRSDISGGGEITVMPGGGTLDLRAGYQATAALFEESNGVPFDRITHQISERNRWRFRPRTALFHDTTLSFVTYPNSGRAFNYLDDSTPIKTRLGLTGLVTERIGTTLAAGYGASFVKNTAIDPQYDSFLAQAEIVFYLSQTPGRSEPGESTLLLSTLTFGYIRDFQQSFLGNFYTSDKGYGRADYWFGNNAVIALSLYAERLAYPDVFINGGPGGTPILAHTEFDNLRFGGDLFAEYRFAPTVGINTTLSYVQTVSDTQLPAGASPGGVPLVYDLNYRRIQAFLGARWFY